MLAGWMGGGGLWSQKRRQVKKVDLLQYRYTVYKIQYFILVDKKMREIKGSDQ
jgi:hypothetical protein